MTYDPRFAPEQRRRRSGVLPFPIILPGCCGCGVVGTIAVVVVSVGLGLWAHDAEPQPADVDTGASVVHESIGR